MSSNKGFAIVLHLSANTISQGHSLVETIKKINSLLRFASPFVESVDLFSGEGPVGSIITTLLALSLDFDDITHTLDTIKDNPQDSISNLLKRTPKVLCDVQTRLFCNAFNCAFSTEFSNSDQVKIETLLEKCVECLNEKQKARSPIQVNGLEGTQVLLTGDCKADEVRCLSLKTVEDDDDVEDENDSKFLVQEMIFSKMIFEKHELIVVGKNPADVTSSLHWIRTIYLRDVELDVLSLPRLLKPALKISGSSGNSSGPKQMAEFMRLDQNSDSYEFQAVREESKQMGTAMDLLDADVRDELESPSSPRNRPAKTPSSPLQRM
jgi:hypothetical protein